MRLGKAYLAIGDPARAETAFRRAGRLLRQAPQPGLGIAAALLARGESDAAVSQLRKVLRAFPTSADAWSNLGNVLRGRRDFSEAARCYRRVLAFRPADEAACLNLAVCLTLNEQLADAEVEVRRFMAQHGSTPDLLCNLAQALRYGKRYAEAEQVLRKALGSEPGHAASRYNLALTLSQAGDTDAAERMLRELLADNPHNAEAHGHLGELLLGTGRLVEGWREWRWRDVHVERAGGIWQSLDPTRNAITIDALLGRHVRVKGEQGLGDVLFFLRYAPELAAAAASVTLDIDARLKELLGARPPLLWRAPPGAEPIEVPAGDLPCVLGAATVAPPVQLSVNSALADDMRRLLESLGPAPYIGITWEAGTRLRVSSKPGRELHKRIEPEALAEALRPARGTIVSLQRNAEAADATRLAQALGRTVPDLGKLAADLPRTLSLLSLLDRYVGVSNTNMHLLAGLGRTADVLIPAPPDWRWMRSGDSSPWFPGFRIHRQGADLAWTAAIRALHESWRSLPG